MISAGTRLWFARHELTLAWRDTLAMLRGGRRRSRLWMGIAVASFPIVMHLVAYGVLIEAQQSLKHPDKATIMAATGSAFLAWALLLSQSMETATRGLYARADLDLILSSPSPARRLFTIRIGAIALSAVAMASLLLGPFIDVAALLGGARFLCAYGVLAAMGLSAAALAVAVSILLFGAFGPSRTRLVAQILAAVVGAGFVIGVQAAAIMSYGSLSRTLMFASPAWLARAPGTSSAVWWPARGAMGDIGILALMLGVALVLFFGVTVWAADVFPRYVLAAAGRAENRVRQGRVSTTLNVGSPSQALRRKEWLLLWRDPWLVSQSLMQVLYLVPPALMLWRSFGTDIGALVVLVPVLVMAAGQLGGGLAWLALSGEDAPDLVATAPVSAGAVLLAKIEAVLIAVAVPLLPFALVMAWLAPAVAATMIGGGVVAATGASTVQLLFRSTAKRSGFRRRQTSSRIATFAEAFLSISVAAASGLAAAGHWFAIIPMAVAGGVLLASRAIAGPVAI